MPLAGMRRKHGEEAEAAGAAALVAAVPKAAPLDRPAKRTRAAVAAAAAAAAAAEAAAAKAAEPQQQQQAPVPPRAAGKRPSAGGRRLSAAQQAAAAVAAAAGTESGVGSTQQGDRCGSSDPRVAGGVDSSAPPAQQAAAATDARALQPAPAPVAQAPAPAPVQQQQQQQPTQQQKPAPAEEPAAAVAGAAAAAEQPPPAKKRRLVRQGMPAPLPRSALLVPDRFSAPIREDDADGHYVFEIGDNLAPRFKIMRKFGEGTFGQVLECWDRHRRDYVAVKVIRNIQKYRDAAKIELEVLATLARADPRQEQHCVKLLEWFDYRGHVCMVFERLGPSLYDYLRKNSYRPFPLAMARDFMRQMLESVAFMHSLTLVHTDLKPENVLVTSMEVPPAVTRPAYGPGSKLGKRLPLTNVVRVIDFGSATFNADYHSSVVSTRHYRAPEIILGLGWSYPADLWSMGCILVELVTGDALFQTHENLEHLAMMEQVLGPIPPAMALRANDAAQAYFVQGGRLNWPAGAESKKSVRAVQKLRSLDEYLFKHMDEGMRPHLDTICDLVQRLMTYQPSQRMTAEEALGHEFFSLDL